MTNYTTLADASTRFASFADARRYIIARMGDSAHLFDIDAIAAEVVQCRANVNSHGHVLLNTAGFEIVAKGVEFWEIVGRHEL